MRRVVRFLLNAQTVSLATVDPTVTVLEWLRSEKGLIGTKEGCAEGDCGACTILVGRLHEGELVYEAINACIRFVATLDACHVVTIEHLKARVGALHPVQRAMVEMHGSQCGFCTPGFVMSLMALWLSHDRAPSRERIEDALAGNLCRCTGYGPIVAALGRAYELDSPRDDPFARDRAGVAARLAALDDGQEFCIGQGERRLFSPANLAQLATLYLKYPQATLIAGATDFGIAVNKEMQRPQTILWLGRVAEFDGVSDSAGQVVLGAGVSLTRARQALGALHPEIAEMLRRFGGEQVRNAGTIGGSIANGSPIGDLAPVLIALGATLTLRCGDQRRRLAMQDFFLEYKRQDRRASEFVESIEAPKLLAGALFHVSKISKRFDEDISALLGAFHLSRDADGRIQEARLAFGGMAGTPKRAARAEAALIGRQWTHESSEAAARALARDFTPLDDWRASAAYRSKVAANLIRRFYLETGAGKTSLRVGGSLRASLDA